MIDDTSPWIDLSSALGGASLVDGQEELPGMPGYIAPPKCDLVWVERLFYNPYNGAHACLLAAGHVGTHRCCCGDEKIL